MDVHPPPTCSNDLLSALPQRFARWLQMAHDRADGDELVPRQEFLAIMTAVRRSGVIAALASLQNAGWLASGGAMPPSATGPAWIPPRAPIPRLFENSALPPC